MFKYKIPICLLVIFLGIFLFYWFQLRPAQIKHDCSWVKHHSDAIPERSGKTEAQLKEEGKLKVCPTLIPVTGGLGTNFLENAQTFICESDNEGIINKNRPQKYTPAKDWREKSTDEEYKFCLRDKGL